MAPYSHGLPADGRLLQRWVEHLELVPLRLHFLVVVAPDGCFASGSGGAPHVVSEKNVVHEERPAKGGVKLLQARAGAVLKSSS